MEDWEQIGILSGHRGLVLALAVYKDRLISGLGSRWNSPPGGATAHHRGRLGQALQVSGCGRSRPKGRLRCGREARLKSPILRFTATGSDDRCIRVWRMGSAGASQRGDWECERTLTGHNGGVVGVCFIQGVPPPRAPRRPAAPPPSRCASCTPRDTASHHGHGSARPHLSRKWHDLRPTST